MRAKIAKVVERPDGPWRPLSASQQGEMDGATVMIQEALDQVSVLGGDSMVRRTLSLDS